MSCPSSYSTWCAKASGRTGRRALGRIGRRYPRARARLLRPSFEAREVRRCVLSRASPRRPEALGVSPRRGSGVDSPRRRGGGGAHACGHALHTPRRGSGSADGRAGVAARRVRSRRCQRHRRAGEWEDSRRAALTRQLQALRLTLTATGSRLGRTRALLRLDVSVHTPFHQQSRMRHTVGAAVAAAFTAAVCCCSRAPFRASRRLRLRISSAARRRRCASNPRFTRALKRRRVALHALRHARRTSLVRSII